MELLQRSIRAARWVPHVRPTQAMMASPSIAPPPPVVVSFPTWPAIRNIGQCCHDHGNQAARYPQPFKPSRGPTIAMIQAAICKHFDITKAELISANRETRVCLPRQIAMWFCRRDRLRSYPEIGRMFGGRDHTTGINAVQKVERLQAASDPLVCAAIHAVSVSLNTFQSR